uniref:Uncharacterized protein n=1 Tax=Roseihalotalea indica TaxID=2867963 RepID=A0AA49JK93_9BACT|nr:hypothetical protein K4G66_15840 [Tunicatimonas sp. TK19036]
MHCRRLWRQCTAGTRRRPTAVTRRRLGSPRHRREPHHLEAGRAEAQTSTRLLWLG